jgi:hypothetical protein
MCSWLQKFHEIVRVPLFPDETNGASCSPAENRLNVRNGTVTIGASRFPQRDQSAIVMKTLFGSFT